MFDFHLFPFTDFNKISLEWIIDCLKALRGGAENQILAKKSDEEFDFEWIDNTGGAGGTSNYNDLTNKPSINNVLLAGNKTSAQLGLTPAAIGAYVKPSGGIPKSDLDSAVQTSLGKADTALQSAPVTSVNGKTGAVGLSATDVGAIATPVSPSSGQFLSWNGSAWIAASLPLYNGGVG